LCAEGHGFFLGGGFIALALRVSGACTIV
jgi:hypothetical protein